MSQDHAPPADPASVDPTATPPDSPPDPPAAVETRADQRAPVTEAIRDRKRARSAEQQLQDLTARFGALQQQLDDSQQTITALERRQKIDALLADSDAIDLDAARLLTEVAVSQMDEPDLALAIEDLQQAKPYLFRHRPPAGTPFTATAMGPRLAEPPPHAQAAQHAAATGNRRDLMDYLRLRRNAPA